MLFEYVYLDSAGFRAYELTEDEKEWLNSEERLPEFGCSGGPCSASAGAIFEGIICPPILKSFRHEVIMGIVLILYPSSNPKVLDSNHRN